MPECLQIFEATGVGLIWGWCLIDYGPCQKIKLVIQTAKAEKKCMFNIFFLKKNCHS